jgi:hypothetical protein
MTSRFEQFELLQKLATRIWEGDSDPALVGQLEALLRDDGEARRFYLHLGQLHARLTSLGEQGRFALIRGGELILTAPDATVKDASDAASDDQDSSATASADGSADDLPDPWT